MDKLTTSEKLILGGGIAYLIFMFFPWYGVDGFGDGFTTGGTTSSAASSPDPDRLDRRAHHRHTVLARHHPDLPSRGPRCTSSPGRGRVIVLLRTIIGSDESTRSASASPSTARSGCSSR